jgi:hypothetical protein
VEAFPGLRQSGIAELQALAVDDQIKGQLVAQLTTF